MTFAGCAPEPGSAISQNPKGDRVRVAVIEDEQRLAENIAASLRETEGFAMDVARDGEEGLYLATSNSYDALVLDLMLPRLSGIEILARMRKEGIRTPVLVLSAKDELESVLNLLDKGADDYLTKPFDLRELRARLRALIRRSHGHAASKLIIGDLEMDTSQAVVRRAGLPIALMPMEYKTLEYLMHRQGEVVSKTELLEHLYDFNWEKFSNVIEVYIAGLRKKIEGASERKLIHTMRGHGYMLHDGAPD
jgi:two-component system response regulator PhoP